MAPHRNTLQLLPENTGPGMAKIDTIRATIRSLATNVQQRYTRQRLKDQHDGLLDFLGVPRNNFHRLQRGFDLTQEQRLLLFKPIVEWYTQYCPRFPDKIQGSMTLLCRMAGM